MSHSSGPWKVVIGELGGHHPFVMNDAKELIAMDLHGSDRYGDARLIAVAPDLLEAAKTAVEIADSWIYSELHGTSKYEAAMKQLDPIYAAIKKAEG